MIKLNKEILDQLNYELKTSNKNILAFLKEYLKIDVKYGYVKSDYFQYNGDMKVDNKIVKIGVTGNKNIITTFEYKTS